MIKSSKKNINKQKSVLISYELIKHFFFLFKKRIFSPIANKNGIKADKKVNFFAFIYLKEENNVLQ